MVLVERGHVDRVRKNQHAPDFLALDEMDLEGFHLFTVVAGVEPSGPITTLQEHQDCLGAGIAGSRDHRDVPAAAGSGRVGRGPVRVPNPPAVGPVPAPIEDFSGDAVEPFPEPRFPRIHGVLMSTAHGHFPSQGSQPFLELGLATSVFLELFLQAPAALQGGLKLPAKGVFAAVFGFFRVDHVGVPFRWLLPMPSQRRTSGPEASRIDRPVLARAPARGVA